jgi:hypothetical protein
MSGFRAGAAVADITPQVGGRMDGYGGRSQGSEGVRDPLMARVVVLEDGRMRAAVVSCDLLGIHPSITERVRAWASTNAGIGPDGLILAATHNHAGPVGLRAGMFGGLDEDAAETLVTRVCGAIREAEQGLRPASLKAGSATIDTISMNRRDPDWPVDPLMQLLLVDRDEGPVASILNFACHATVLSGSNLMLSGEFPGAAARLLLEQTGAPCVYLNGACADVNPTWIRQDFESVDRVGQVIGGQALRLIGELRTLGAGQRAHNIRWDEFTEKAAPGRIVEPSLSAVRRDVELPLRAFAADQEYAERVESLRAQALALAESSAERREVMAQVSQAELERWAAVWARRQRPEASQVTEVQALRLGEGLALLALPGEFFVETAAAIRGALTQSASGGRPSPVRGRGEKADVVIACYANDYVGYVVPERSYDEGGYEAGITPFAPEAEGIIRDASIALLSQLMRNA